MRIKNVIPHSTLFHATAKFPYKDSKYYVTFPDEAIVTKALEALLSDPARLHWDDATYGETRKVYCKRHREYADREVGRFRRFFYIELENYLSKHDVFSQKKIKLQTIRGTMSAEFDNEVFSLFSFPRDGVRGTAQIQYDEATLKMLKIPREAMELVVKAATEAHAAEASSSS